MICYIEDPLAQGMCYRSTSVEHPEKCNKQFKPSAILGVMSIIIQDLSTRNTIQHASANIAYKAAPNGVVELSIGERLRRRRIHHDARREVSPRPGVFIRIMSYFGSPRPFYD